MSPSSIGPHAIFRPYPSIRVMVENLPSKIR
jgi:hypothetical protein